MMTAARCRLTAFTGAASGKHASHANQRCAATSRSSATSPFYTNASRHESRTPPLSSLQYAEFPAASDHVNDDRHLSDEDVTARHASFMAGIAASQRLLRAFTNSPSDRHISIAIDCAYQPTRTNPKLAFSLVNQILCCIGHNAQASRPSKLHLTQWPSVAGQSQFEESGADWLVRPQTNSNSTPMPTVTAQHVREALAAQRLKFASAPTSSFRISSSSSALSTAAPSLSSSSLTSSHSSLASSAAPPSLDALTLAILCGDSRFNNPHTPSSSATRTWKAAVHDRPLTDIFDPKHLVYLSAEADQVLWNMSTDKVYTIGGIVGKTVVKGISYDRATRSGITAARLPIREVMGSSVTKSLSLNVDSVFKILLEFSQLQHQAQRAQQTNQNGATISQSIAPLPHSAPSIADPSTIDHWRIAFSKHIPSRYLQLKSAAAPSRPNSSSNTQPDSTRTAATPTAHTFVSSSATGLSPSHIARLNEWKWQLQIQRTVKQRHVKQSKLNEAEGERA